MKTLYKGTTKEAKLFEQWAKAATKAVDTSGAMLGVWDDPNSDARYAFELQVGHCLCAGKPLLLIVPEGTVLPDKLAAAASAVEYFVGANEASFQAAVLRALAAIGKVPIN